jgi:hypothetical protein
MAVQIYRSTSTGQVQIRFTIDDRVAEGVVSVVGSFNDWTPGVTVFTLMPNGTRSADVTVDGHDDVYFRYLGSGGLWFDDPDADEVTDAGAVLHLSKDDPHPR